jgi:hypothetical protein
MWGSGLLEDSHAIASGRNGSGEDPSITVQQDQSLDLRFELRVVRWAPLSTGELIFTQITSVPFFTVSASASQSSSGARLGHEALFMLVILFSSER